MTRMPHKTDLDQDRHVFAGVDTHKELHVAAAIDTDDTVLATRSFPTTRNGCRTMLTWIGEYGSLIRIGVEGTGSHGAGLTRHPAKAGVTVLEVDRPDRSDRRRKGKDDDLGAINAARAAKTNRRTTTPKSKDGAVSQRMKSIRNSGPIQRPHGHTRANRPKPAPEPQRKADVPWMDCVKSQRGGGSRYGGEHFEPTIYLAGRLRSSVRTVVVDTDSGSARRRNRRTEKWRMRRRCEFVGYRSPEIVAALSLLEHAFSPEQPGELIVGQSGALISDMGRVRQELRHPGYEEVSRGNAKIGNR